MGCLPSRICKQGWATNRGLQYPLAAATCARLVRQSITAICRATRTSSCRSEISFWNDCKARLAVAARVSLCCSRSLVLLHQPSSSTICIDSHSQYLGRVVPDRTLRSTCQENLLDAPCNDSRADLDPFRWDQLRVTNRHFNEILLLAPANDEQLNVPQYPPQ